MAKKSSPTKDEAKRLEVYAGADYKNPKRISVASVRIDSSDSIDQLLTNLYIFKVKASESKIEIEERYLEEGGSVLIGYNAYRMETPDEVVDRVAGYLRDMLSMEAKQVDLGRENYERLKRIYEPNG